jgi:circadian clock protein KaiB
VKTRREAASTTLPGPQPAEAGGDTWILRLHVAGETPKSVTAFENLKTICEERLNGAHSIEVIDLGEDSQLARGEQILAVLTLARKPPEVARRITGNVSGTERMFVGLG